jgi:hypothetical protein
MTPQDQMKLYEKCANRAGKNNRMLFLAESRTDATLPAALRDQA